MIEGEELLKEQNNQDTSLTIGGPEIVIIINEVCITCFLKQTKAKIELCGWEIFKHLSKISNLLVQLI